MKYSKELLVAFQSQYKSTYGQDIDLRVAEIELTKLARFIEAMIAKVDQTNNDKEFK